MNKYSVNVTDTAFDDLNEIFQYIKYDLKEPDTAKNIIAQMKKTILSLDSSPYRNPTVRDKNIACMGYRYLPVGNYIIFYIVSEDELTVNIIRVIYSRRNWEKLL